MTRERFLIDSYLDKEETPSKESEVLITSKISSEVQQLPEKDDWLTGGKDGLSEGLLRQILYFNAKVARVASYHWLHSEPLGAEYISL